MHYVIGFWGRDDDMSGATIDQGYQRNEKLSELVLFYKTHTHTRKSKNNNNNKNRSWHYADFQRKHAQSWRRDV